MYNRICDYKGCQKPTHPAKNVCGKSYCEEHYNLGVEEAFLKELCLPVSEEPSTRFRNLFGRYVEGLYDIKGILMPEQLAGNKLRDRSKRFQYENNTISFVIERHLGPISTCQRWCFDLKKKGLTLIHEEPLYLDCEEVAKSLGVTPATIRKYIKQGRIKAQKASETKEVDYWFCDKLERSIDKIPLNRNHNIQQNKWLISHDELLKFKSAKHAFTVTSEPGI